MGRIQEIDKLKYGCSLCFTDIGAGPLVHFTIYSGMDSDDVEWTCEVCCLEKINDDWRINFEEDLHDSSSRVTERQLYPMHNACWRILEVCWDNSIATSPLDLKILADFFLSQPRGWQLPHMLEGNWVSAGLKFTTGDYLRYRDPDEFIFEEAIDTLNPENAIPRFERKSRLPLAHGKPDCFSLLPVELRLMILCFLPAVSVENIRQASNGMACVPLEGTFWLSRLSEPEYCHLPKHISHSLQTGLAKPGDVPQWFITLQQGKKQNNNRHRIIEYNKMLIDRMLQRLRYLKRPPANDMLLTARYVPIIDCPDEPHPAYHKSEETLTWASEVRFDSLSPFSMVKAITPTYVSSYGGKYLSGLVLETSTKDLVLGYRSRKPGSPIDICDRSAQRSNIIMQSDSRGIFDVATSKQTLQVMQLRKHGKIVLNPASWTGLSGLRVELSLVCIRS
ncbi:MAG: hypothetical protein Q9166_006380 [cf. Caloplaca sp. 2 TL-2023]